MLSVPGQPEPLEWALEDETDEILLRYILRKKDEEAARAAKDQSDPYNVSIKSEIKVKK